MITSENQRIFWRCQKFYFNHCTHITPPWNSTEAFFLFLGTSFQALNTSASRYGSWHRLRNEVFVRFRIHSSGMQHILLSYLYSFSVTYQCKFGRLTIIRQNLKVFVEFVKNRTIKQRFRKNIWKTVLRHHLLHERLKNTSFSGFYIYA